MSIHTEHKHLLEHVGHMRDLAARVGELTPGERSRAVGDAVEFLHGTLAPHAREEERTIYLEVARILGDSRAIDPMVHDHVVIAEHAAALEHCDTDDVERLRELLYGLYALVVAHFRKEEELYLPLLQ